MTRREWWRLWAVLAAVSVGAAVPAEAQRARTGATVTRTGAPAAADQPSRARTDVSVAVHDGRGLCLDPDDGCRSTAFRPDGSLAPPLYYAAEHLRGFTNLEISVELVPAAAGAICSGLGSQNAHLERIAGERWALLSDNALLTPVSQCVNTSTQVFWLIWTPRDRRSGSSALKSQTLFLSRWR